MNRRRAIRSVVFLAALTLMATSVVYAVEMPQQDEVTFTLQLRDGSIIRVNTADSEFAWKTVAADGSISQSKLMVSDIKRLKLTVSPASDEVARIRGLVAELASDSYRQRHKAESILLDEGKPFEQVIQQASDHREPEVRYRVDRILTHLKKKKEDNVTRFSIDFDVIELQDGRKLEGDIGEWALQGTWNDVAVKFDRSNSRLIMTDLAFETWTEPAATDVATRNLMDALEFYGRLEDDEEKVTLGELKEGFMQAAFDKGPRGEVMINDRSFDVSRLFSNLGVLMKCETNDGIVVISGYRFKQSQSRNRSIGNFFVDPERGKKTSYQGVMRIDFCVPGNENVAATVHTAGLFAEIVKPRHTIVQAYNASGHIIGLSESATNKMAFLGIDSKEPIAYLKVSANNFFQPPSGKLNRDFAIDDLTYSPPAAAPELNFTADGTGPIVITTRDHQRLLANSVSFNLADKKLQVDPATEGLKAFKLPLQEVVWVTPPQNRETSPPADSGVYVMLEDGSVVHCQFEQKLVATFNSEVIIDPEQVIGVWSSGKQCRYPQKTDFDEGEIVLVRPRNRVVFDQAEFDWANGRFDYDLDSGTRIYQALKEENKAYVTATSELVDLGLSAEGPDPGQLDMADCDVTIWTAGPATRAEGTGLLRTNDGQEFVLNGEMGGFKLVKADGDQIVLEYAGREVTFEMKNVHALNLPK